MHPSDSIRGSLSNHLQGKRIVLGVSGSIAAVRSVEIARELIRHGAEVLPVLNPSAEKIVTAEALRFATGKDPVLEITGRVEHVAFRGDALVVAPATANTLAKISWGIADSPVTLFASTHVGSVPVLVFPAMHTSMLHNPALQGVLRRLEEMGVVVVHPLLEEGEAKLPEPEVLVEPILHHAGKGTLRGRRILVVGGSTEEDLDEMRVLTNRGSGKLAHALAQEAYRRGAEVEVWWGRAQIPPPPWISTKTFRTLEDLWGMAESARGFDSVLVPAALSDFVAEKQRGKVPSTTTPWRVALSPAPKFLERLKEVGVQNLVSFKAESGVSPKELAERAQASLERSGSLFVVANDVSFAGKEEGSVLLVERGGKTEIWGSKAEIASRILDHLEVKAFGRKPSAD